MIWVGVLSGSLACYVIKLAGLSMPQHVLDDRRVQSIARVVPVALLATLIAIQTFTTGHRLTLDARAGGLVAAALAQLLRAPFLVVVVAAAATTALLRLAA